MQDARTRIALLVVCLACLLGSGFVLLKGRQSAPPPILFAAPPAAAGANTPDAAAPVGSGSKRPKRLYVDVAGAVRRPSLYLLPPNSRVMQAVLAAGGPTPAADMDAVNLAQPVTDGEKVFVPRRGAVPVSAPPGVPSAMPAASARVTALPPVPSAAKSAKASGGSRSGKMGPGEQIGLNSATVEQLERLPSVGPSMAARIIAYRQQCGGFAKIEDLTLVTGIGPKKYAKIAPFLTL